MFTNRIKKVTNGDVKICSTLKNEHKYEASNYRKSDTTKNGTSKPSTSKARSESPSLPDQEYEVEEILDYQKDKESGDLYLIKWKNWDSSSNTWEPPGNLTGCDDLLYHFYLARKTDAESVTVNSQSDYVPTSNGCKRRKPCRIQVPPDPRPLEIRANEFFRQTRYPTKSEIQDYKIIWKKSIYPTSKKAATLFRWSIPRIEKTMQWGMEDKLGDDELKKLRGQLLYTQFDQQRRKMMEELKDWEDELNHMSQGRPVITVENDYDTEGRPQNFTFTNDYVTAPGITIPDDPPVGCPCDNSVTCSENKKTCCPASHSGYSSPYNQYRSLRVPLGTPIYECNKKCMCGTDCINRVVQDGRSSLTDLRLCIFRTSNGCGWGVKTLKTIKKGSFVTLYIGEIINTEVAEKRGREYDAEGCTYLFDLDFNEKETCPYTVDAAKIGNISHFINHSCDPNLGVFAVWVNCLDPDLPKLALFALTKIPKGEELTFDYKNQNQSGADTPKKPMSPVRNGLVTLDGVPLQPLAPKKPCLCGSANCRKFLF